ncbi:MAG: UTP--glucose-1-phosphate uridylyltransferase GalU [Synergistaceae bacterium]|nr:UTP--glucose-1-phosphate uridylyltransferase GalU [Synergistaceae bacterium]
MGAKISRCLFPAAGLGTRFLPVTKEIAKEMLPLVNRPIISYGVEEAVNSGCDDIVIITGRTKRSIEDYFDCSFELESLLKSRGNAELYEKIRSIASMANFMFVRQPEPLGLGHAVLCGEPVCRDEYFGVILPDDVIKSEIPVLLQLIRVHEKLGGSVIALEEVPDSEVSRYGIVDAEDFCAYDGGTGRIYKIRDMVEKPSVHKAPSRLAIIGRYILSPKIFAILADTDAGIGGELQLTDALRRLLQEEPVWGVIYQGERFDCGTQNGWFAANVKLAMEIPELRKIVVDAARDHI